MAIDIISELDPKDLNEFKKDFAELIRVYSGINREYSKLGKDIDKYIAEFNQIINLFNKKYKDLVLRLKRTINELQLRIFIKDSSVKDVFMNVASKLDGLKAIGSSDFGKAKIEEADRFSKELDKVKNKLFVSYFEKESGAIFLEYYKKGMVELHHSDGIGNERSPSFKLCSYYAVKGGVGRINIDERLSAIGFTEIPILERVRNFFKKFNPRIEE
jgi:hypothetical protein